MFNLKAEEFGRWLIGVAPELIILTDKDGLTPLHLAFGAGAEWLIKAILENNPLALNLTPLPWVKACENGHISTIRAFINYCPGSFKDHCRKNKDSPLHHVQLQSLTEYEEFICITARHQGFNQCSRLPRCNAFA